MVTAWAAEVTIEPQVVFSREGFDDVGVVVAVSTTLHVGDNLANAHGDMALTEVMDL